eukprot:CAMPEP_0171309878 /NCGR_PEP_ID=MMETSP0816-20121228/20066_1 /TAXON_ID=420281 /ORGANISM="Proboscia inermis, Strain CCAP1064/1" /LENGTH=438 /DNA_ID=CAMNT_0011793699 /DNA_START=1162 /DNA_END=2478 /DNA_ORIENTATION=+
MASNHNHHLFMSHVWATGQDKTHSIARKLKMILPNLKIWLDVDNLKDISRLEDSVAESTMVIIFYSAGYFESKNCRRELNAAVNMEKPTIVIFEGDEASTLRQLKDECFNNCYGRGTEPTSDKILEHILTSDPIAWFNDVAFSAAAMNRIFMALLRNLPFYTRNKNCRLLDNGIIVPGETNIESIKHSIKPPGTHSMNSLKYFVKSESYLMKPQRYLVNVLVCAANVEAFEIAEEVQGLLPSGNIKIHLVDEVSTLGKMQIGMSNELPEIDFANSDKKLPVQTLISSGHTQEELIDETSALGTTEIGTSDGKKTESSFESNDKQLPHVKDISLFDPAVFTENCKLLVYLNKDVFQNDGGGLESILRTAIDMDLKIVLVFEQNPEKGACPFGHFFSVTPQELIDPPYEIFRDIAIPLHVRPQYRNVSLQNILEKIISTF